ncbi:MAG: L,D-transpeptidase family protein [gamma proteobacterium symbiont of Taylorina sp.]|nr:L,D-transpeptidase family protein [gamma proteobacterium symbiont of Taylorina sp.]
MFNLLKLFSIIFLLAFSQMSLQAAEQEDISQLLQQQLQSSDNKRLFIGQNEIVVAEIIKKLYQYNDYHLAWKNQAMLNRLFKAIHDSYRLGLTPDDYHFTELKQRLKNNVNNDLEQRVQLDIIMTDALLRLAYHLGFGKVVANQLDQDWNLRREFMTADPVAKIQEVLQSEQSLNQFINQLTDLGLLYEGLIKALSQYRKIEKEGGWQSIPDGSVIKAEMQDSRLPLIKSRLQISAYISNVDDEQLYDKITEDAVKQFQKHHNLDADGVIGKDTLQQMNISVEKRIDQIKANLERVRWVKRNLEDEFVLVNIAGFKVYYVRDNKLIWKSKVQVGKDYRKTPVFRDDISYIAFNPTWTIPPTILRKDILPKLKKDPSYLQKKNMNVIDSKGKIIQSDQFDWSTMTAKKFPYMIRQEPGVDNALGRVKIMFPNKHMVYLHDTPSKSLFNRTNRAFSSGCIRVENPFELVSLLLNDSEKWNQSSFNRILDSGQLQNVRLPAKVPVLLLYFTVQLDDDGRVTFFKDIYHRDEKIIKGLTEPFQLVMPSQQSAERNAK